MLVTVNINGVDYESRDDEKILSLCLKVGIFIPHICYLKDYTPSGRCGLCVVDINNGSMALACLTTVKDGMVIKTESYAIDKIRRNNMTRILKTHTTDCLRCFKSGRCKLQKYITKIFEPSIEDTTSISDKDNQDVYTNITDDVLFNQSKCIKCNRCVRFLCETCNMDCKTVDVADYSSTRKNDLYGNIIDICPTAALKANNNVWKICQHRASTIITHDISNVFTPKIQVTTIDNEIVNISSMNGLWIPNGIRFIKKLESDNDINIEMIVEELPIQTLDKKVFIIGNDVDIETLFLIQNIVSESPGGLIVIDDSGLPLDVLKNNLGIPLQDINKINCAIFVGMFADSEIYYIKKRIRDLKKVIEIDDISELPDISELENPYAFIAMENFKKAPPVPFSIIPRNSSQMFIKHINEYLPLSEFETTHNKHDVRFVCTVGKSNYVPKEGITTFHINGKHFLSESGYYFNVFNKIVYTNAVIDTNVQSSREIFAYLLKILHKENYQDVLKKIYSLVKDTCLNHLSNA